MQITFKFFVSFLLCFALLLLSGCGGGVSSFTPAEQAEVDKYVKERGREALIYYLGREKGDADEQLVLKYVKYLVSQGADVNASLGPTTPLDCARRYPEVTQYLKSKGAKSGKELFGR